MVEELCKTCRNYFSKPSDKHFGKFTIANGSISLDFLKEGQYFRIVGSMFNDGVYQFPASSLKDEAFDGGIWAMNIPPRFIALATKIKDYNEKEGNNRSAFTSESFGGYSYSKATNSKGAPMTWKNVFADEINEWRKIR